MSCSLALQLPMVPRQIPNYTLIRYPVARRLSA